MDGRPFQNPEAPAHTPDYGVPLTFPGGKMSATSSPKRRQAVQKRVVSVPIADVDGSRSKGEGAPPSDSWAWRKYGQKPIKGSPYPRGYYRCSSSKGCPARKRVERSCVDPTMLMVTYTCEHNHPCPLSRTSSSSNPNPPKESPILSGPPENEPEYQFTELETDATLLPRDVTWFSDPTPSPLLGSPICMDAMLLPTREEEDELFADLGELPEYSTVL